jgi:CheY-like chemotaxis protein
MHGGAVTADSAGEGQGATFTVTLPLLSPTDRVENQKSYEYKSLGTRSKPRKNLKGLRVLVVDDEFDARELFNTVLSQHGADVRTSSSAAEALETIEGWRPNLLVSDIGMPGEDGLDLIKKVRAREPERCGKIPALALTAYASNEDRRRVLSAGYHMHVAKPVGPEELMSAILSLSSNLQD